MRIDLHTHSNMSDGTDTPAELIAKAAAAGLDVVALTDHDTTRGWAAAVDALPSGLTLVRGAELSCQTPDGRGGVVTAHLLAYLFDPGSPAIVAEQKRLRAQRWDRVRRMAERMAEDGLPVDPDDVLGRLPDGSSPGRPHLGEALQRAGVVATVQEAFQRFLSSGSPYYVPKQDTPVRAAIDMIRAAGGVTVLAHAFIERSSANVTTGVIADLATAGLGGIEVDHPNHDERARTELRGLATELGLPITGSSDYHGRNKPTIRIGDETTNPEMFEALMERATGVELIVG